LIGIDVVPVARIETILASPQAKRFLARIFLEEELQSLNQRPTSIAGYYASKEAIVKALKCGIGNKVSFLDICLKKDSNGAPSFTLSSKAQKHFSFANSSLSITHDNGIAIAVAIVL